MWGVIGGLAVPAFRCLESVRQLKAQPCPVRLPVGFERQPVTPTDELNRIVAQLDAKKSSWARLGCKERAALLQSCLNNLVEVSRPQAEASIAAKGSYGSGLGEEW